MVDLTVISLKQKSHALGVAFIVKDRQRLTLPGFILVPSALVGLTALFGMGRGDPHRYSHLKIFKIGCPTLFTRRSCKRRRVDISDGERKSC